MPPIDPRLAAPCKDPASIPAPSYQALAGSLGVALIQCGQGKAAVVQAYDGLAKTIGGK